MQDTILRVANLSLELCTPGGPVQALHDLTFGLRRHEILGMVGESGSGKTLTALTIMGLLRPPRAAITSGSVELDGRCISTLDEAAMRMLRGRKIAMVFQDPLTALNPYLRVSTQLTEALVLQQGLPKKRALERAVEMCREVGIPQPDKRIFCYPHELSGGMRQRVLIAMALLLRPQVLIADEPTSAIDAVLQEQLTAVFQRFRREHQMSMLLITHDLDVLARCCDRVIVMYGGRIVEENSVDKVFERPRHPYTRALLQATLSGSSVRCSRLSCPPGMKSGAASSPGLPCPFEPRCEPALAACREHASVLEAGAPGKACRLPQPGFRKATPMSPLLELDSVHKLFAIVPRSFWAGRGHKVTALAGVSLALNPGETLGIVGESGSGKSTLAKVASGLLKPDAGSVRLFGTDLASLRGSARHSRRKELQMIFQDPYSSLDPRMTVAQTVAEPLEIAAGHGLLALSRQERHREVHRLLEMVGLGSGFAMRTPSELSGGQRQRVSIARALALKPKLLVCDEPTSALDVSVQARIINLLLDIQAEFRLSYIFISHNLAVVRHVSDRVGIMQRGKLVELDETEQVFSRPKHPYTASLISSVVGSPLGRLGLRTGGV